MFCLNFIQLQVYKNDKQEFKLFFQRQIPLVKDPENKERFAPVRINPTQLQGIQSKAGTAKNPGTFLLNKIADLIFTKEELGSSKGVSSLSSNKMEAFQDNFINICKNGSEGNDQELIKLLYISHPIHLRESNTTLKRYKRKAKRTFTRLLSHKMAEWLSKLKRYQQYIHAKTNKDNNKPQQKYGFGTVSKFFSVGA